MCLAIPDTFDPSRPSYSSAPCVSTTLILATIVLIIVAVKQAVNNDTLILVPWVVGMIFSWVFDRDTL